MENNDKTLYEIESELYALVKSISNLYDKYQQGIINDSFFRKAMKNAMKGLLKIKIYFNDKNISLTEILINMNFIEEYNKANYIFNEIYMLNSPEAFKFESKDKSYTNKNQTYSILDLPKITSEITSSFITLMDALKLEGLKSSYIVLKLFKELKKNIKKFPGLEGIQSEINEIYTHVIKNVHNLLENKRFRNILVDKLYQIFKEFQHKLNLST